MNLNVACVFYIANNKDVRFVMNMIRTIASWSHQSISLIWESERYAVGAGTILSCLNILPQ